MKDHPFVEKYNPDNYQPEVFNFLADFSSEDIINLQETLQQQGTGECLNQAVNLVNATYSYRRRQRGNSALSSPAIERSKQVDCYGYCIALSQVLQTLNINHKLAFANTHSFVLAADESSMYVADAFLPCITGKLEPSFVCHAQCVDKGIFSIDMYSHAHRICKESDSTNFLRENPWVRFSQNLNKLSSGREEARPTANPALIVRAFEPAEGIRTLYAFDSFKVAVENNNLSYAYYLSKVLSTSYPELDIRNAPKTAEQLIQMLGSLGLSTLATQSIENIASGRLVENTVSSDIWRAQQYTKLGRITKLAVHYDSSASVLNGLLEDPGLNPSQRAVIRGKLTKLSKIRPAATK